MQKLTFLLLIGLSLMACQQNKSIMKTTKDVHSFSNPNEALVHHLNLDIKVDFNTKTISGCASWNFINLNNTTEIIFDTKELKIEKVTLDNEQSTTFELMNSDSILGSALKIKVDKNSTKINIYYTTSSHAEALQWLNSEQTAGKEFPFLFTQSQAILARTWIPCMDGPGVRFSYTAKVEVPKKFLALMSATNPQSKNDSGIYQFVQEQKIPSYLMALTVGDFEFKKIGARTGVYAERVSLEKCHTEFSDMEKMLTAAEKLYGKYQWNRYDVIVLPPSFPFGGMENPCLTFATPTIIAGDKSLTSLVAHELAHSWSGNLVTNATWSDFWLNEGFTVYFERRIMEELYGPSYSEMLAFLGYTDLQNTLKAFGADHPDTKLKIDLSGRNPDDGVTDIAYEKGFFFIKMLEAHFGREKFDQFLNAYFSSHAFTSTDTESFLNYLKLHLFMGDTVLMDSLKVHQWIYETGLPNNFPKPSCKRFELVDVELAKFLSTKNPKEVRTTEWTTHEWLHFIDGLPENLPLENMEKLDAEFSFSKSGNSEILDAWFLLSINTNHQPAYPFMREFLITVGRRKFLTPLYKALMKTKEGQAFAKNVYKEARPNYHFVAVSTIDRIVSPEARE